MDIADKIRFLRTNILNISQENLLKDRCYTYDSK